RVERFAVVAAHVQPILAAERAYGRQHHIVSVHESAGRATPPLDLHDGASGGIDGISELIRKRREKVVGHGAMVTDVPRQADHPNGLSVEAALKDAPFTTGCQE